MVYYAHAPYGFPDESDYTGTQAQRIADLKKRGYGNDTITKWNRWYEDQATAARVDAVIRSRMAVVDAERAAESQIQLQREQTIYDAGVAEAQRLQQIKDQEITFNEQVNSGDYNETPITDVNLSGGCSECTGTKSVDPIPQGVNNQGYMKMAGIAAIGIIGLMVVRK